MTTNTINEPIENLVHPSLFRIARTWAEGGFDADWRLQQVEAYLGALAGTHRHIAMHLDDLKNEKDVFVLNFLALRRGAPDTPPAYAWAWKCYQENPHAGLASVIKSLAFAGCSPLRIAAWLGIDKTHIEVFLRLFWEIEECMKVPAFRSMVLDKSGRGNLTIAAALREHILLKAAAVDGLHGVKMVLTKDIGLAAEELERVQRLLKASTVVGAYRQALAARVSQLGDPFTNDPYADRLRSLAALPESVLFARDETFEDVMRTLGSGTPLNEIW